MAGQTSYNGLLLNPPADDHWHLGGGLASERFGEGPLNPSGDWRQWLPSNEEQKRFGLETMNCTNYASVHAWVALANFYGFQDFMQDASERYTGVHTNTSPTGNDPHHVAEIIRRDCGLVQQELMPWTDDIDSWDEYYDESLADLLLPTGKNLLDGFELGHEWVFAPGSSYSPNEKTERLKEALTRGTVCVSVSGRYRTSSSAYYKEKGERDTHWIHLTNLESTGARIMQDQYKPFLKRFAADYDHDAAKVYFLKRKDPADRDQQIRSLMLRLIDVLRQYVSLLTTKLGGLWKS